ncbi:cuticle protein 18.7 [Cephus cinctus]|uniref:Cuticle protein 18.7 n=1 Tax=Cephus cinctus TaxID=211228 RepID=A0AAJ7FHE5_CEPCN|nr:cuticle protein 18.7 [Cephus cinctus]
MKCFIVLSALVAVALGHPSGLHGVAVGHAGLPLAYSAPVAYAHVVPGAPIGADGRVVDTPEVAVAKAEHAAAHINEKVTLAHEAAKNLAVSPVVAAYSAPVLSGPVVSAYSSPVVSAYSSPVVSAHVPALAYGKVLGHGAPIGIDGTVVDTPEVAVAKAAHFAAHAEAKARLGWASPAVSVW